MIADIILFTKTRTFVYLVGAVLALLLLGTVYKIGCSIQEQRTAAHLEKLSTENKASAQRVVELEKQAAIDAAQLAEVEKEIAIKNNLLLDARAEVKIARERSNETRIQYVNAKTNFTAPTYLTGDASIDSAKLCTKLREKGAAFACEPKPLR